MKKVFKMFVIVLMVIIGLVVMLLVTGCTHSYCPADYSETVKTGGNIESTYLKNGSHTVAYFEQQSNEDFEKYEIWYPKELESTDASYPLIVVLNGTGVKASKYKAQFDHFASWGFIVIGTEEKESWDGIAADSSLAFMLKQNEDASSVFYHKVDTKNIGAMGHSQGGAGVFNAITEHDHSSYYKTAVSVSPTNEQQAISLGWHYDLSKINIPVFLLAGTKGDFEMKHVLSEEAMNDMYDKISSPKAKARKLDCEHGDMLYSADGYITAWFMWQLTGDEEAGKAFIGDCPELLNNELYEKVSINLQNE